MVVAWNRPAVEFLITVLIQMNIAVRIRRDVPSVDLLVRVMILPVVLRDGVAITVSAWRADRRVMALDAQIVVVRIRIGHSVVLAVVLLHRCVDRHTRIVPVDDTYIGKKYREIICQ